MPHRTPPRNWENDRLLSEAVLARSRANAIRRAQERQADTRAGRDAPAAASRTGRR
jgi:hypothetical protein